MLETVLTYISDQKLIESDDTVLVAVSGGIDSMALLVSLTKLKYNIGCAHVNHQLRSSESDADADFVRSFCIDNGIRFHHVTIPDDFFESGNMHEKARIFRYQWLHNVAADHGYSKIATAHHLDDRIETFLMQAMRGTGLDGLESIPKVNGIIVRPFLGVCRKEIEAFASHNSIPFREDSSNASDKYLRNKVRNHLIPMIAEIDTRQGKGLVKTLDNIGASRLLLEGLIEKSKSEWIRKEKNETIIDLQPIRLLNFGRELLYHLLNPYHFNSSQSITIFEYRKTENSTFLTQSHKAFIKHNQIYISDILNSDSCELPIEIALPSKIKLNNVTYDFEVIEAKIDFQFLHNTIYLDADLIGETITLRNWQQGDKMKPLGMKGESQSLQDIFTNQKLTQTQKENIIIFEANDQIGALLCWKTSEIFKVTDQTLHILRVSVSDNLITY